METSARDDEAAAVLEVASDSQFGLKIRYRTGMSDNSPVTLWAINQTNQKKLTNLRDPGDTDKDSISLIVPRQTGFAFDSGIPTGAQVEIVLNSNQWWTIEDVEYDVGTAAESPCIELNASRFGHYE